MTHTVPPLLTGHLRTQGRSSDDQSFQMVGISGVGDTTPLKKILELNVSGDNEGSWLCLYLQCEFYTKTFYKPSVFVLSMPRSNH